MKRLLLFSTLLITLEMTSTGAGTLVENVKFASLEKAKLLLNEPDEFTNSWSQFDIDSRLGKSNSTKEALFDFISKQAREWSEKEIISIKSILEEIDQSIKEQNFEISLPDEIYLVKTTANEEGNASGYTRANYIVLKESVMSQSTESIKKLLVHELFHVLTRNNEKFRTDMYEIIGFRMMNQVEYPESLKKHRITNPDAPQTDSYITINVNGAPKTCMMILYANREYSGGDFFKYLSIGFLSLTGEEQKSAEYQDEKPVIFTFQQVSDFFEQVGKNTQYIIHPEEILADNFSFTILSKSGLPNPEIIKEIKNNLSK